MTRKGKHIAERNKPIRIEVISKTIDTRAKTKRVAILSMGFYVDEVYVTDVYTVDHQFTSKDSEQIAQMLSNPVTQRYGINEPQSPDTFDFALEIGFLPGVTDNIGNTAKEMVTDLFKIDLEGQLVYCSQIIFITGKVNKDDVQEIADAFYNPVIQRVSIKSFAQFTKDGGMDKIVPRVDIHEEPKADVIDLLEATDEELETIGKKGIEDTDGTRRGPLSMDLLYMRTVQDHFKKKGRNPTDVELESIAQTWSEHCKHTIFADPIDEFEDGLYKTFIKRATNEIRKKKGKKDFCVSVFTDNAGGIVFDRKYLVCDKVETHNSPSALDPFGGAITGIVGVNRDAMGFGMGAKPIINRYGYCFADPRDETTLYKGPNRTQKMLSARRIMDGVIEGVNVGGNCSGIPTTQGFAFFDSSYRGKPLVFVGTIGLIPRRNNGSELHEKKAKPGDLIVMVGGRVGKDGIHGATFSSEAIDSGSPATAVQIGDPITQKKMSDAIVKEARDIGLYNSITDNGAGGLSCSVAEMAKESGGAFVELEKVPLKYPGLAPWETWISESQERMTLAVPEDKWEEFHNLMTRRGVEATVIGQFTDSGMCIVTYNGEIVMDIDMEFLHDGLPQRPIQTQFTKKVYEEPNLKGPKDLTATALKLMSRANIASIEFISQQYDHEVQGGSVMKPLQGKGRVNGDATVVRPRLDSDKGVIISHGLNPTYSEIDTYHMAACAIDTAVRNAIAAGASMDHLALLDNFCWCSSNDPERLGQLKRACQACYDVATEYGTPFISGKDSMFNDFKGFNEKGEEVKISILPTLLISSIGVVTDVKKTVSIDPKQIGDLVYIVGDTAEELGGSEYYYMLSEDSEKEKFIGNTVPVVNTKKNLRTYKVIERSIRQDLVASVLSVHRGGLMVALAKTSIAGQLGLEVHIDELMKHLNRPDHALFSESQGRLVVTVDPAKKDLFERVLGKIGHLQVGYVTGDGKFKIKHENKYIVETTVDKLIQSYRSTFKDH